MHGYAQIVVENSLFMGSYAFKVSMFCFGATLVCLVNDQYGGL